MGSSVDGRQQELGPDDAATLRVMTDVSLAAAGRAVPSGVELRPDVDELSAGVHRSTQAARDAVAGLEVLGPTRFGFFKRFILRAARLVTHRLVAADRHLADALDAMATVQREQVGHVQRMSDAMRGLVASADLTIGEALEELRDTPTPSATADGRLALLEARVAELEARLAERDGEHA